MISALILSAGQGLRFDRARPKQLVELCGKPLFMHALALYQALATVDRVVLVINPDTAGLVDNILRDRGFSDVTVVPGGDSRQQSIRNGLEFLAAYGLQDEDKVILHNGASPNVPAELVEQCLEKSVSETIVQAYAPALFITFEVDGENMGAVLPRDKLGYTCDPTVYQVRALRRVLAVPSAPGSPADSTVDVARALGMRIALVPSPHTNIKVTTRWELEAVARVMANDN